MTQRVRVGLRTTTEAVLTVLDCADCGIIFGITAEFERRRRDDHKGFHCPSGHSNVYNQESAAEKASREADYWKDRAAGEERRLEAERRAHSATKGQLTKTRNRIQNGVCPECNRHFANVERHMAGQHPKSEADVARAKRGRGSV